jgi:uncharacterized protein (UPF0276 family)
MSVPPASASVHLPDLGVGMIYMPGLEPLVEAAQDLLDVIEIEPQTSWYRHGSGYGQREEFLQRVERMPQRKLVHGVGFPIGGTVPPDPAAVRLVGETVRRLSAPWVSEHLSFNRVEETGREYGTLFLLPPIQTPDSVAVAARSIASMRALLSAPIAFETGVNYLRRQPGEMSDGAFFAAVAEAADCGILLDLHNLWCNEKNGRQPVLEVVGELPLHRVWEMHLAGGQEMDGYWLDAHSGPAPDELLELAATVVPGLPVLHALNFEMMPTYLTSGRVTIDRVLSQLESLRGLWESRGLASSRLPAVASRGLAAFAEGLPRPAEWESMLGRAVLGFERTSSTRHAPVWTDPGIGVIRTVVGRTRAGMVADALPGTVRLVLLTAGENWLQELFGGFWRSASPEQFAGVEAEAFGRYLLRHGGDIPYLADIAALELAVLRARGSGTAQQVPLSCDPFVLLDALARGILPPRDASGPYEVVVPAP